jgi:predicted nucleotidyltransferase
MKPKKQKELNYFEKGKRIVNYLKEAYDAQAIVFLGSRAVGDYGPQSDWDILILTDKKKLKDESYTKKKYGLKDEDFDLYIYPTNQKFLFDKFGLKLRYHKVKHDPRNLAKNLLTQAKKQYDKGPKITKEWALGRRDKATRYMKKLEDLLEAKAYPELYNKICWHFVENVIVWWYMFRKMWPLRPQQKFKYIEKKDKAFYKQLKKVFSDKTTYKTKVKAFKEINLILFESKRYKNLIK